GCAGLAPGVGGGFPLRGLDGGQADAAFHAEVVQVAAGLTCAFCDVALHLVQLLARLDLREPAVAETAGTLQRRWRSATDPDRNWTLDGQRVDPGLGNLMIAALEVHYRLG